MSIKPYGNADGIGPGFGIPDFNAGEILTSKRSSIPSSAARKLIFPETTQLPESTEKVSMFWLNNENLSPENSPRSPFVTPTSSPVKSPPATPDKVRQFRNELRVIDTNFEPLPEDKQVIEEGIETIKTGTTDTPKKRLRSSKARELHALFLDHVTEGTEGPVAKHSKLVESFENVRYFAWVHKELKSIYDSSINRNPDWPPLITPVNYKHIVNPVYSTSPDNVKKKPMGWHYCSTREQFLQLKNPIFSMNGCFSATFSMHPSQPEKRSTFFPLEIRSIEDLDQLIQTSEFICACGNRSLRYIPSHGIWIEAMKKNEYINTAYPLLFLGEWKEAADYLIFKDHPTVFSEWVFKEASRLLEDYNSKIFAGNSVDPIRYTSEDGTKIFIDIGPALPKEIGINQGIIFIFESKSFN